jgi:hypothetical protein
VNPIVYRMGNLIKFVDAKPVAVSVELTNSVYDRVKRRTLQDLRLLLGSCLDLSNIVLLGLLCQVSVPLFRRNVLPPSSE